MAAEIAALEVDLLTMFVVAAGVGIFVAKVGRFPYTIALLLAGLVASALGLRFDVELSHDLILLVLLPPLLFEGAATTDLSLFRRDLPHILALAVPGLLVSVAVLGLVGTAVFGFPLLVALLFAAMILPTDPVSVLALFEEVGAPDRLATLVEGESLINDGVGVVLFTTLLGLVVESREAGVPAAEVLTTGTLWTGGVDILVGSVGGALVGAGAGYAVYGLMARLDEHMTEIVLTIVLAYGAFLLAEHYLGVSGVLATVVAGLFIGNRGAAEAMSPRTKLSVFNTWDTAAFLVNTLIFLLIGAKTPISQLIEHAALIGAAIVLVVAVRALVVYPALTGVNLVSSRDVPLSYQHVAVWGGLHASIPIALVLGLPPTAGGEPFPLREELRAMVFGVAAFSLVVQGLSMHRLLDALGVVTRSAVEELYELLVGRARAVDAALEAAERLRAQGHIPEAVYEDFEAEYGRERADLNAAVRELLEEHPDLRREELLVGERRVLTEEKNAVREAMRAGVVADDVGERLLDEADLKLDRVLSGQSTVREDHEDAYEEFWRRETREFGLDVESAAGSPEDTEDATAPDG